MDNLISAFVFILVLAVLIDSQDKALFLWLIGFATVAFAWNIGTVWGITSESYDGFGKVIILAYWCLIIIAFGKTMVSRYQLSREAGDRA